jgi:hypothetical protein
VRLSRSTSFRSKNFSQNWQNKPKTAKNQHLKEENTLILKFPFCNFRTGLSAKIPSEKHPAWIAFAS